MIRIALLVSAALLGPRLVLAQGLGDPAPRGGLFGTSSETPPRSHLDLTAALSEAFDSAAPPEFRSRIQQTGPQAGGYSSMIIATADYERNGRQTRLAATADTAVRYYQDLNRASAAGHSLGLGGTLRLHRQATLEFNQTAEYSPSYLYQLFPSVASPAVGEAAAPALDYRALETQSYSYETRVTATVGSARGHRGSVTAERTITDFRSALSRPDLDVNAGRAKWSHGVGRTGSVSVEYEYRQGEFGYGATTTEQRLRIGGEYSPALSISRRAHFSFNLAPSALNIPESATNVVATGTLYRLEGEALAEFPFLRSWSVGGRYLRGFEYLPGLLAPVFRDTARLELSGLVSRRVDLSAVAGLVVGQSALASIGDSGFDSYVGNVRGRYSFTRSFALYAEYLYYNYDLRGQAALAPGLTGVFEQHGIRAGLMLWARPVAR